ncbi:MAG: CoA activase, partial [Spirochaetota bacterium]|nr:CoA activase [Spirochaetota bacterium]
MHCAGIDIGSVSVNTVIIDEAGRIISRDYRPHHGTITDALKESLESHDIRTVSLAVRTANTPDVLTAAEIVDDRVAAITAARSRFSRIGSLLIIGGEHFSMIHFDEAGAYRRLITNSSCAAGTGSFLDQQAGRLSLRDSAELSSLALENIIRGGETPKI